MKMKSPQIVKEPTPAPRPPLKNIELHQQRIAALGITPGSGRPRPQPTVKSKKVKR